MFCYAVPVLKEERYRDLPLPTSHAEPYVDEVRSLAQTAMRDAGYRKKRMPSQHLIGDMIPCAETVGFTEASPGQPIAHPSRAEKRVVKASSSSTQSAYIWSLFLVVAAAAVTWIIVPVMAYAADQVSRLLSHLIVERFRQNISEPA
jgi:hypothetical protein